MKFTLCITTAAAANAQLAVPNRLRATYSEWGRSRRTAVITRTLESSMSFSMPQIDASMPELDVHEVDSSMSMYADSMSMVGDMEWAVPDEPEIILGEVPVIVESAGEAEDEDSSDSSEDADSSEDFVDGEFMDMKLEANSAASNVISSVAAITALAMVFL